MGTPTIMDRTGKLDSIQKTAEPRACVMLKSNGVMMKTGAGVARGGENPGPRLWD